MNATTTENPVITLLSDCTLDTAENTAALNFSKANTTLNLNGCKIFANNVTTTTVGNNPTTTVNDATLNITGENLAIENGTFDLKQQETTKTLTINVTGAGVTFGGVTVNGDIATAAKNDLAEGEQQTSLTLVNCTVNGKLTEANNTTLSVQSGSYSADPTNFVDSNNYKVIESAVNNTETWTVEKKPAE